MSIRTALATSHRRARLTLGNLLLVAGIWLLLFVGGLYADAAYQRYAARGDTAPPAPQVAVSSVVEPAPWVLPSLTQDGRSGQVIGTLPSLPQSERPSTVERLVLPSIGVDSKVVEVGWEVQEQNGAQIAVWQVAEYAVGQHKGSANPGEGDNIVLAGHVGGYGKVFKDLFYLQPGDPVIVYSKDAQYRYVVQERRLLNEEGVSLEQQAANAQYIAPTDEEVVTLVTCWPATGPDRFTQRLIVRAVPFHTNEDDRAIVQSNWTIR